MSHEALGVWEEGFSQAAERSEGSFGNILVTAGITALGLHPWDSEVLVNQVLVELSQAAIDGRSLVRENAPECMELLTRDQ